MGHAETELLVAQVATLGLDSISRKTMSNCRAWEDEIATMHSSLRICSDLLFANARHDVSNNWLNLVGREGKRIGVGNDSDGFAGAVHDNLAGLAFVEVRLQTGPKFRIGGSLQVVAELGQKISATEHRDSLSLRE